MLHSSAPSVTRFRCIQCGAFYEGWAAWCSACCADGALVHVGQRTRAALDGELEVSDARTLAKASWTRVECLAYPTIDLRAGAMVVIHGPPASGKSTMLARALDSFRPEGAVILGSYEEPPGPSLGERLGRLAIRRADFVVTGRASIDQLGALVRARKAVALGIDSAQASGLSAEDLRRLLTVTGLRALFVVSQQNKAGKIEGRQSLPHEADVVIAAADLRWRIEKTRYSPIGIEGAVLEAPQTETAKSRGEEQTT